jgi:hypothetical protein
MIPLEEFHRKQNPEKNQLKEKTREKYLLSIHPQFHTQIHLLHLGSFLSSPSSSSP